MITSDRPNIFINFAKTLKPFAIFYFFYMTSGQYERELKSILEGETKTLEKVTKTCTTIEKMNYLKITKKPFAVIRAAGSFGCDLIASRGNISFLTEVKTSSSDTLHFSSMAGKLQEQAEAMIQLCEKTKNLPIMLLELKINMASPGKFLL